jgi:hypothetical protein
MEIANLINYQQKPIEAQAHSEIASKNVSARDKRAPWQRTKAIKVFAIRALLICEMNARAKKA